MTGTLPRLAVNAANGSGALIRLRRRDQPGAVDRLVLVAIASLAVFTGLTVARGFDAIAAPGLDMVVDTATSVTLLAVAMLVWARFRARGDSMSLSEGVAFTVLTIASVAMIVPRLTGAIPIAVSVIPSTHATFYLNAFAQAIAGGALVAGGLATMRGTRPTGLRTAALTVLAVVGLLITGLAMDLSSPPLSVTTSLRPIPKLATAVLFAWALLVSRRVYRRDRSISDAYLVVALVFAGFAEIHSGFDLDTGPGLVTSTDALRLAFVAVLLVGLAAGLRASVAALREANLTLEILKDAELERAALEERARLSRELHDGLAQNLWVAKLKVGRLTGLHGLSTEAAALSDELATAIDAGLAEARQAVMALRVRGTGLFKESLTGYVDEFADTFSLRTELRCDGDLPRLQPRAEAELLRIAQEALSNARRHADATLIQVDASVRGDRLLLTVEDNGRGFETTSIRDGAFGLVGMRERAALIGGELTVLTRPRDGTTISVDVPLAAIASGVQAVV